MLADTQTTTAPAAEKAVADARAALASACVTGSVNPKLVELGKELDAAEVAWDRESDRTDEVKAEQEGREITAEDEAIWQAANSRHEDALERVLEYRPRNAAELAYKARLIHGGSAETRFRSDDEIAQVYLDDALALENISHTTDDRAEWDERLARFAELRKADEAETTKRRAAYAFAREQAPKPLEVECYGSVQGILNDRSLSPARQAELIRIFREWEPRHDAALKQTGYVACSDEESDAADDARAEAEYTVVNTPAPDIAALCEKLRLHLMADVADRTGDDIDDPRFFSAALATSCYTELVPLRAYQDALRLAGLKPEIARAEPFDPAPIIEQARASGIDLQVARSARGEQIAISVIRGPFKQWKTPQVPPALDDILEGLNRLEVEALRIELLSDEPHLMAAE